MAVCRKLESAPRLSFRGLRPVRKRIHPDELPEPSPGSSQGEFLPLSYFLPKLNARGALVKRSKSEEAPAELEEDAVQAAFDKSD